MAVLPPPVAEGLLLAAVGALLAMAWWIRKVRRQARELAASEARFRHLFENAIEGVYESTPEGQFIRVNLAMARILGFTHPSEVVALKPEQVARLYALPTRRQEFFAALGGGDRLPNFESQIRRPDGALVWIKENVRAVRDAGGRILYLQGFTSDVSARRAAESALRSSEVRYRVLFEHLPIPIVEYDYRAIAAWLEELRASGITDLNAWLRQNPDELHFANARIAVVGANAAALRLFGVRTLAEWVANLERTYTPEVYAARHQTFVELWKGGSEASGEFHVRTLDGRMLHLYFHWRTPIVDGRALHECTQFALVDLTHIKAAEFALAAERERLSVMLRAMSEAVFAADRKGVIQFINEAAAKLTGWSCDEALGRPLQDVCVFGSTRADRPTTPPAVAALAADHPVDLAANLVVHPREGPARRVEGRCAPMHDAGGRVVGVMLVVRDVTQRLQLEADVMRASKMESLGVLAGGIAHDFNNLLTIVMGNLTLALLDDRVRAAGEAWLREAERGAMRARELTQQLLTFAKGGEPVRSAVLLPAIVKESAEFALRGAKVRCDFELSPDLRPADADKDQIGQVVQNLVVNAVEAMHGAGTIRVNLRNESLGTHAIASLPKGNYLRLEIADTGNGIAPEHISRIFEPFFTTKQNATGLGLATVYSIVQKHRGHIAVDSAPGQGTVFRIWLPAAREPAPPGDGTASGFEPLRGRVLFMDDEEPIRVLTKALLDRVGLETTVAADGAEAVRLYEAACRAGRPFDLVIVDLTVPGGVGGAEAMRQILKIDPAARGIVSSGYSSDPVMANHRAHGFLGMVPKPYRVADFTRTIRAVLGQEKSVHSG